MSKNYAALADALRRRMRPNVLYVQIGTVLAREIIEALEEKGTGG